MNANGALAAWSPPPCATTILPAGAILSFGNGQDPITLADDVLYQMPCATVERREEEDDYDDDTTIDDYTINSGSLNSLNSDDDDLDGEEHKLSDFRDPFYATQFPMCYALAATTVTSYMLVIMLFVTPRSFLDGGIVYLGQRGFTSSASNGVSIGGRPWLQKVAALTVAISLTVATADTFRVAQEQYSWGIQNARAMQLEVMGSIELKVIRLISDTFLWLAQAQTLIRLFPRQREKNIIKWAAFALITLDVIFTALNSFQYSEDGVTGTSRPNSFVHPIPALSYLFQLTLGLLYAAWVIYYSLMKKRYAFYHPLMKNICLVAIMSVTAVVIPVVFFILDISKPEFTGWGDYVRWVGAAAASVVVWEWVERIEALEREEKKDGILGREVFDGDDTLEVNAAEFPWLRHLTNRKNGPNGGAGRGGGGGVEDAPHGHPSGGVWPGVAAITGRYRGQANTAQDAHDQEAQSTMGTILRPPLWPPRPAPAITPVSRTDTASAASTVYAIRYQGGSEGTTRTPEPFALPSVLDLTRQSSIPRSHQTSEDAHSSSQAPTSSAANGNIVVPVPQRPADLEASGSAPSQAGWRTLTPATNPSPSQRGDESQGEARGSGSDQPAAFSRNENRSSGSLWDFRSRLEEFAANKAEKLREKIRPTTNTDDLPVTVIPAPPRRGTALQQVLEEEEMNSADAGPSSSGRRDGPSRDASVEMVRMDRSRNIQPTSSRGQESPLPPNNPPLWPGVQPRLMYDYDDGYSSDGDSLTDTSSVDPNQRESEDGSGPSRHA
jgi:hypothetical protein